MSRSTINYGSFSLQVPLTLQAYCEPVQGTAKSCLLCDTTRGSAVKRFSISFARHPTNGFELYSMVPSICPLETLHNSLSLKQVDEFLASVAAPSKENLQETSSPTYMSPLSGRKISLNTYTPAKIQPTPLETLPEKPAIEKPASSSSESSVCVPDVKLSVEEASLGEELSSDTLSENKCI